MIHQNRRKKLLSQFAANSLLIISTNSQQQRSGDVNYPFRPDSDFWYLTGFTEPEAVAVFSDKTQIIFLRDKDSKSEIWDGEMLGVAAAAKALGFDLAYDIKKLNSIFPTLLGDFQNYYYDFKTTDFDNIISP
ncbi:MAG: Xaa-Pro aminopeptidase, partial [Candidatus Thioglobus sp.]|nr:Xaa-Pro aminopeptidase [Candidatus Thioglobus sp.]